MILLVNGAFGIGKTTVARVLVRRLPRAILFDPELAGIALQRLARAIGREVEDFQDWRLWRRLTVASLRVLRLLYPNIVVPMAFSNIEYLEEIRAGIRRFEPRLYHFCLVAPIEVVRDRLRQRRSRPSDEIWQFRRAAECCVLHQDARFAQHIRAEQRESEEIAEEIFAAIRQT